MAHVFHAPRPAREAPCAANVAPGGIVRHDQAPRRVAMAPAPTAAGPALRSPVAGRVAFHSAARVARRSGLRAGSVHASFAVRAASPRACRVSAANRRPGRAHALPRRSWRPSAAAPAIRPNGGLTPALLLPGQARKSRAAASDASGGSDATLDSELEVVTAAVEVRPCVWGAHTGNSFLISVRPARPHRRCAWRTSASRLASHATACPARRTWPRRWRQRRRHSQRREHPSLANQLGCIALPPASHTPASRRSPGGHDRRRRTRGAQDP